MIALVPLAILVIAFVIIAGYATTIYNSLVAAKNNVPKAWANIDVLLKQRHDEIPKLIKSCEGYMKYENDTLRKVIELRSAAQSAQTVAARAQKEGELTQGIQKIFALAENYPELKAQSGFQQLQNRISDLENQIADRREFYNDSVTNLNTRIESVPDSFIANFMGLKQMELFKISEEDRKDVDIQFNMPA